MLTVSCRSGAAMDGADLSAWFAGGKVRKFVGTAADELAERSRWIARSSD
jgi:hypothetical protein